MTEDDFFAELRRGVARPDDHVRPASAPVEPVPVVGEPRDVCAACGHYRECHGTDKCSGWMAAVTGQRDCPCKGFAYLVPTPTEAPAALRCEDCARPYADFTCDLTLPDDQWVRLHPSGLSGYLCPSCMVLRAATLPGIVAVRALIEEAPAAHIGPLAQEGEHRPFKSGDAASSAGTVHHLSPSVQGCPPDNEEGGGVLDGDYGDGLRAPHELREEAPAAQPCENGDCKDHYGDPAAWCPRCQAQQPPEPAAEASCVSQGPPPRSIEETRAWNATWKAGYDAANRDAGHPTLTEARQEIATLRAELAACTAERDAAIEDAKDYMEMAMALKAALARAEQAEKAEREAVAALDANWVTHQRVVKAEADLEAARTALAEAGVEILDAVTLMDRVDWSDCEPSVQDDAADAVQNMRAWLAAQPSTPAATSESQEPKA